MSELNGRTARKSSADTRRVAIKMCRKHGCGQGQVSPNCSFSGNDSTLGNISIVRAQPGPEGKGMECAVNCKRSVSACFPWNTGGLTKRQHPGKHGKNGRSQNWYVSNAKIRAQVVRVEKLQF